LLSSEFEPLISLAPGIPSGRPGQSFNVHEVYIPTWVEWGILLGMAAFFCTLVTIGVRRIVLPGQTNDLAHAFVSSSSRSAPPSLESEPAQD